VRLVCKGSSSDFAAFQSTTQPAAPISSGVSKTSLGNARNVSIVRGIVKRLVIYAYFAVMQSWRTWALKPGRDVRACGLREPNLRA